MPSKLLIHEPPLQVLPSLAKVLGLNEAIVAQQVHYWLENIARTQSSLPEHQRSNFHEGRWWTFQSIPEWRQNSFPFWSEATIRRTFGELIALGVIVSKQLAQDKRDRTNWYSIDYQRLNDLIEKYEAGQDESAGSTSDGCIESSCADGSYQSEQIPSMQNEQMLINENPMRVNDEKGEAAPASTATPDDHSEGMLVALTEVTGMDQSLNHARLIKEAQSFVTAGYTAAQVRVAFGPGGTWYSQDWRGKKGDRPTLKDIREQIAVLCRTPQQSTGNDSLAEKRDRVKKELREGKNKRHHPPATANRGGE